MKQYSAIQRYIVVVVVCFYYTVSVVNSQCCDIRLLKFEQSNSSTKSLQRSTIFIRYSETKYCDISVYQYFSYTPTHQLLYYCSTTDYFY